MTRTPISETQLPTYSKTEEIINSASHFAGCLFGIFVLISCLVFSIKKGNIYSVISSIIYGASVMALYGMSGVYHSLKPSYAKRLFRIIDHSSVFILIAGSYTPILLCAVRMFDEKAAFLMFAAVWGVTFLGTAFNFIDLKKFTAFSIICYLTVGWLIILEIHPLYLFLGKKAIILLFAGGLCYTVGTGIYGIGKKKKYFHSVFHFFVLAGTIIHYILIRYYIL